MISLTVNHPGSPYFEIFSYPAGEMQVRIKPMHVEAFSNADNITVTARITKPEHIVSLALLKSAIDGVPGSRTTTLVMPYLPFSRADRRFTQGDCDGMAVF